MRLRAQGSGLRAWFRKYFAEQISMIEKPALSFSFSDTR